MHSQPERTLVKRQVGKTFGHPQVRVLEISDQTVADNSGMLDEGPQPSAQEQLTLPDTISEMTHCDQTNPETL